MADWKITKKVEGCARCEHPFEEGERHFSLLMFDTEHLGREDRCGTCFAEDEDLPADLVFWRTRKRVKPKRGLAVDFESIEKLFLALEGRSEPRLAELRFLLSLLLMRKRRIKMVRVKRTEEAEFMICRRPRRDDIYRVQVFDLTSDRAAELKAELERIFEGAGAEDLQLPAEVVEGQEQRQTEAQAADDALDCEAGEVEEEQAASEASAEQAAEDPASEQQAEGSELEATPGAPAKPAEA